MFDRRSYKRIPLWENRKRCRVLVGFRDLVIEYFESLEGLGPGDAAGAVRASKLRFQINHDLHSVERLVRLAGVTDRITYREPAVVGGRVAPDYSLLANLFRLWDDRIPPIYVLDLLERAIGNLENDRRAAMWRTVNPLFWLGLVIDSVARIPFALLGLAGFDRSRMEDSFVGKLVRLVVWLAGGLAAAITLMNHFNLWDRLPTWR